GELTPHEVGKLRAYARQLGLSDHFDSLPEFVDELAPLVIKKLEDEGMTPIRFMKELAAKDTRLMALVNELEQHSIQSGRRISWLTEDFNAVNGRLITEQAGKQRIEINPLRTIGSKKSQLGIFGTVGHELGHNPAELEGWVGISRNEFRIRNIPTMAADEAHAVISEHGIIQKLMAMNLIKEKDLSTRTLKVAAIMADQSLSSEEKVRRIILTIRTVSGLWGQTYADHWIETLDDLWHAHFR
ncbi:MAG: hypothetical protein HY537_12775, partial [Deltaproteobacteria bacterium]|nr:hypothetical protein [Deltaproteobacteria bacterium]